MDTRTDGPASSATAKSMPLSSNTILVLAVALAALVRIAWALQHGLAMEMEGAEYARIGENLLKGRGYVGMFFDNGTQLNFPPLYPLMIAALSLVTGSGELAARAINIGFGAALVIPTFKIAESLYDLRAALAVAALVIFHPILVAAGASTYSEGIYLTLMMFALLYLTRWVADRRPSLSMTAGVFFGLAYLTRPEAFLGAGIFVAGGLVAAMFVRQRRSTWIGALAMAGTFAILAAPNVAFLTYSTGHLRIEGKGTLAYQWGQRMNQGMSYDEAAMGIGSDLSDQGVFMRPNLEVIDSTSVSLHDGISFMLAAARKNVGPIVHTITEQPSLGSPWLFILVVFGLCRSVWNRHRAIFEGMLIATAATFVLVLLALQALWLRYFIAEVGVLVLWAGKGAEELHGWASGTVAAVIGNLRLAKVAGETLKWIAIVFVLAGSLHAIPWEDQFAESLAWERRDAGRWLAQQEPQHKRVMSVELQTAYHADADLIFLPFADSDLALRYIAKRQPDYIVLAGALLRHLPYAAKWFQDGIPDKRAILVYDQSNGTERIKIYRWVREPSTGS